MQCEFPNCTRDIDHDGAHGIEPEGSGIVFAPYGGNEGELGQSEPCPIRCDCCASAMTLRRLSKGGGRLVCTSCEQTWHISHATMTSTVIATLYPHDMDKKSKLYDEFLDHKLQDWKWKQNAELFLGLISQDDFDQRILQAQEVIAKERLAILAT